MKQQFLLLFLISGFIATAQVKFGNNPTTVNANSLLELESTNKGFVPPRVALTATNSPAPLAAGLLAGTIVYNTASAGTGSTAVVANTIYTWNGTAWSPMVSGTSAVVQARLTTDITVNTATVDVIFNQEVVDNSDSYNNTTGIFTAPAVGFYLVHANMVYLLQAATSTAQQAATLIQTNIGGAGFTTYVRNFR